MFKPFKDGMGSGFGGVDVGQDGVAVAALGLQLLCLVLDGGFGFTFGVHHAIDLEALGLLKRFDGVKQGPVGKLRNAPFGRRIVALMPQEKLGRHHVFGVGG